MAGEIFKITFSKTAPNISNDEEYNNWISFCYYIDRLQQ